MIQALSDAILGKAPLGLGRVKGWWAARREHLMLFPVCEVCGGTKKLEVHHIEPFHLHPELELVPSNLMTLCESKRFGVNCHLFVGHLGNYRRINVDVRKDVAIWREKLTPTTPSE